MKYEHVCECHRPDMLAKQQLSEMLAAFERQTDIQVKRMLWMLNNRIASLHAQITVTPRDKQQLTPLPHSLLRRASHAKTL